MENILGKPKLLSGATVDTPCLEVEKGFANGQPGGQGLLQTVKNVRANST